MNNAWINLKLELGIFGIKLENEKECSYVQDSKLVRSLIIDYRKILYTQYCKNYKKAKELLIELANNMQDEFISGNYIHLELEDEKTIKLFLKAFKGLKDLCTLLGDTNKDFDRFFRETGISRILSRALNRDFMKFSKKLKWQIIDYKILLDWIYRRNQKFIYLDRLLSWANYGPHQLENFVVKSASGFGGFFANLDLPMLERVFPFGEVAEDLYGRGRDSKHQARYTAALEAYNNDGRVGEGHYWVEYRNLPYSWDKRETESPYPQIIKPGAWR
jgi:hypothetical protein